MKVQAGSAVAIQGFMTEVTGLTSDIPVVKSNAALLNTGHTATQDRLELLLSPHLAFVLKVTRHDPFLD